MRVESLRRFGGEYIECLGLGFELTDEHRMLFAVFQRQILHLITRRNLVHQCVCVCVSERERPLVDDLRTVQEGVRE